MRKHCLLLAVFIFSTSLIFSQAITNAANPESAGFSSARLKRLDTSMAGWVSRQWMNGAVGLVIRNGKIVYYKGYGY
jgi:hypothetical protein